MNAGMQDTFNLAWKLAFVLSENLPDLIKELAEE
jgi:2-polyprenyl-6-methoxyphenol hydroxylase-like FAD-dependent oxidoreductase